MGTWLFRRCPIWDWGDCMFYQTNKKTHIQKNKKHFLRNENMAHEKGRSSFIIIINLDHAVHFGWSFCSFPLTLQPCATIRVYHIISFMFRNGWYSTRLQVSPLRCVSHSVCHHINFKTVGMKVITTNNFALYIIS